jgi:hypothetical protein
MPQVARTLPHLLAFEFLLSRQSFSAAFQVALRVADHPLTDLSEMTDHLLELAAKLSREVDLP